MIDRLAIRDFKSIANLELALGRITVVVGQNGAGKTSLLTALQVLTHREDRDNAFANGGPYASERFARRTGAQQCEGYEIEARGSVDPSVVLRVRRNQGSVLEVNGQPVGEPALDAFRARRCCASTPSASASRRFQSRRSPS